MAGGAHDADEDLLGVGAVAGAVAAAHLADDHSGPDGLFGAPVGGVERGVPQEEEHGREFGGQVPREALGVVERRRCVDQPTEPGGESAAGRWLAQRSRVAAVPQVEAGPQNRLHLAGPGTVRIVLPELLAALRRWFRQVWCSPSKQRYGAHPLVGPQHRGGIVEPPAGADGVDRRVRGDERPQPVAHAADAPAGLVRRDHGRANLLDSSA